MYFIPTKYGIVLYVMYS